MRCKASRKAISRCLDGELAQEHEGSLQEHLARCPACQAELAAQRRLWDVLVHAEPIASPDVYAGLAARLARPPGWAAVLANLRPGSAGYAVAAALLIGLSVWTGAWAGALRHGATASETDRALRELWVDVPPGMEVMAVLDGIGERP